MRNCCSARRCRVTPTRWRRCSSNRCSSRCLAQISSTCRILRTAGDVARFVEGAIGVFRTAGLVVHGADVRTFRVAAEEVEVYEAVVGRGGIGVWGEEGRVLHCEGCGEGKEEVEGEGGDGVHGWF